MRCQNADPAVLWSSANGNALQKSTEVYSQVIGYGRKSFQLFSWIGAIPEASSAAPGSAPSQLRRTAQIYS